MLFASRTLGLPAGVLGLAFGLGAVGGLAGAVLAPRLAKRYGVGAAGVMIFDINLNAVQTAVTADHVRSRMAGVFSTINYGSRPLGAAIGGVLGSWIGIRPTLLLAAVGGAMCNL